MPLTDFQAELARLLSSNRTSDSYLAGGAAIVLEPNTSRFSRALDYFHDSPGPVDLEELKRVWLEALDSVEPFVASRPPDEIGCVYYSAAKSAFVDPREAADAVAHFGRPGGVLPRVGD